MSNKTDSCAGAACACPPCPCPTSSRPRGRSGTQKQSRARAVASASAAALSPNTSRTYATGWNSFCSWAGGQHIDVSSASPADVQGWLVDLAAEGKKPSTLRTYRAAVAHSYDELGGDNPARDPQVRRVLSGLTRQAVDRGYAPEQAAPLRQHHIDQIAGAA